MLWIQFRHSLQILWNYLKKKKKPITWHDKLKYASQKLGQLCRERTNLHILQITKDTWNGEPVSAVSSFDLDRTIHVNIWLVAHPHISTCCVYMKIISWLISSPAQNIEGLNLNKIKHTEGRKLFLLGDLVAELHERLFYGSISRS